MSAWFPPLRARVMMVLWATVAIVGLAPVLYLAGLVAWQFVTLFQRGTWVPLPATLLLTEHSFAFLPALGWAWLMSPDSLLPLHTALIWVLSRVHAGAIFAVVGLGLIALGVIGVRRHYAAIRAQRQRAEDSRRRRARISRRGRPRGALRRTARAVHFRVEKSARSGGRSALMERDVRFSGRSVISVTPVGQKPVFTQVVERARVMEPCCTP